MAYCTAIRLLKIFCARREQIAKEKASVSTTNNLSKAWNDKKGGDKSFDFILSKAAGIDHRS